MSYNVTQRSNEIGIRMALGAQTYQVLQMVLGQGLKMAVLGAGLGLLAAWGLTRFLNAILYEVDATDPLLFGGIAAVVSRCARGVLCACPPRDKS
ncbi:MAG: FtsX-like permease family protein [Blastocatellia bacterium]